MVFKFFQKTFATNCTMSCRTRFWVFMKTGELFFADRLADVFLARLSFQSAKAFFRNREQDLQALMFQNGNDHAFLRGLAFYDPIYCKLNIFSAKMHGRFHFHLHCALGKFMTHATNLVRRTCFRTLVWHLSGDKI